MSAVQVVKVVQNRPTVVKLTTRAPVKLTPQLAPQLVMERPVREAVVVTQAPSPLKQVSVPGIQGPPGIAGDTSYFPFTQSAPSAEWVIAHNLNRHPSVSVFDSAGDQVFGRVEYDSANQLTVYFSAAFSGSAYLI